MSIKISSSYQCLRCFSEGLCCAKKVISLSSERQILLLSLFFMNLLHKILIFRKDVSVFLSKTFFVYVELAILIKMLSFGIVKLIS